MIDHNHHDKYYDIMHMPTNYPVTMVTNMYMRHNTTLIRQRRSNVASVEFVLKQYKNQRPFRLK